MNSQQKLLFAKVQILTLVNKIRELPKPPDIETALAVVAEMSFWFEEITKHENALAFLEQAECYGV